jgi:hypothetical protein
MSNNLTDIDLQLVADIASRYVRETLSGDFDAEVLTVRYPMVTFRIRNGDLLYIHEFNVEQRPKVRGR